MRYMGGKSRIARAIGEVIRAEAPARSVYLEPFVGGGAILAQVARAFPEVYAFDAHPDLILMYQALQAGWIPDQVVTEEEYAKLRHADPSAWRGLVGFGSSFGGKWFGGYARYGARNFLAETVRNLDKMAAAGALDPHVQFLEADALRILTSPVMAEMAPRAVVYCDPPYAGTTTYKGVDQFDHDAFWAACQQAARAGAVVLVSEYGDPPAGIQAAAVWEGTPFTSLTRGRRDQAQEVLYRLE